MTMGLTCTALLFAKATDVNAAEAVSDNLGIAEYRMLDGNTRSTGSYDVTYAKEYTVINSGNEAVSLSKEGDYYVEYTLYEATGATKETGYMTELPSAMAAGEKLVFNIIRIDGTASKGMLNYNSTQLQISERDLDEYFQGSIEDIGGVKCTIANNNDAVVNLKMRLTQKGVFEVYDNSGSYLYSVPATETILDIPANGKCVVYLEGDGEKLDKFYVRYSSRFADKLSISSEKKEKSSEDKKIYIWFPKGSLIPTGLSKDSIGYYLSTKITYVETGLPQSRDRIGEFAIPKINDTTGMATVNSWYVYDYNSKQVVNTFSVSGEKLEVNAQNLKFYNELSAMYQNSDAYHIYAEWKIKPITASGNYSLVKDVEYSFGKGNWTVKDDSTVYNGDMKFYLDDKAGKYSVVLN